MSFNIQEYLNTVDVYLEQEYLAKLNFQVHWSKPGLLSCDTLFT